MSSPITVTIDTVAPEFQSTPPDRAVIDEPFVYDVDSNEEAGSQPVYSVVNGPNGFKIDAASGVVDWVPTTGQRGDQAITLFQSVPREVGLRT